MKQKQDKNFNRVKKVLKNKVDQIGSEKLIFIAPNLFDFLSVDGQRFYELKGLKIYLQTARGYWKRLKTFN